MSIRRSRKRKREESTEIVEASNDKLAENDEMDSPSTPVQNGADLVSDALQDKDQAVWEAFREEYIESVEQLPLSLHRNFMLMRELDTHTMSSQSKLVPAVLEYVAKRQQIERIRSQKNREPSNTNVEAVSRSDVHEGRELEQPYLEKNAFQTDSNVKANGEPATNSVGGTSSTPPPQGSADVSVAAGSRRARSSSAAVSMPARDTPNRTPDPEAGPSSRPRRTDEVLSYISTLVGELMRTSEEKLNLAQAAYDSVDRHVRLLDQAIREQESRVPPELRSRNSFPLLIRGQQSQNGSFIAQPIMGLENGLQVLAAVAREDMDVDTLLTEPAEKSSSRGHRRGHRRKRSGSSIQKNTMGDVNQMTGEVNASALAGMALEPSVETGSVPAYALSDMPIDPNEPRYCYCNQVSFGEMIACDNRNCSKEWFHLGCVGLTEAPKGKSKWYCNECKENKEKSGGGSSRKKGH